MRGKWTSERFCSPDLDGVGQKHAKKKIFGETLFFGFFFQILTKYFEQLVIFTLEVNLRIFLEPKLLICT